MTNLSPADFPDFFDTVHGFEPFPWQRMLVERVADKRWPEGIDLPTASGKTACIDAAVFLLALGAEDGRLPVAHPGRRRIFFVVDRRIVVDESYSRAERLARKLERAEDGIVKAVADRLRQLAGGDLPLVVSRLRGGTARDKRWRLNPAQPTVVTGTVDQIGSRLLFRSYGSGNRSAPIDAALSACDSLILLDEAHCAVPFMQTARAVQRYTGPRWVQDEPVASPLTFSILSATLPSDVTDTFPRPKERAAALGHELLRRRIRVSKPAELKKTKKPRKRGLVSSQLFSNDALVVEAAQRAVEAVIDGCRRVAVMVNRVATATEIADRLVAAAAEPETGLDAELVLMTGRMRPLDRDKLVERWSPLLRADSPFDPDNPIILVTTQCLEVGADFSFDTLITECASLDALQQRFGRMNRLGVLPTAKTRAAILVRHEDQLKSADDPIYGTALTETWRWLGEAENLDDNGCFDFGIAAVEKKLDATDEERASKLTAPSPSAPVLLPAHLDLLCQTEPRPEPEPEISLFLHGPERNSPEVRLVFRRDLQDQDERSSRWVEMIALLPPLSVETLALPLWLARKWLATRALQADEVGQLGDVEGQRIEADKSLSAGKQPFVIWRGHRGSVLSQNPEDIRPNDTVVVPADSGLADGLGASFCRPTGTVLDIAEAAYLVGRGRPVLRISKAALSPPRISEDLQESEPLKSLIAWSTSDERESGAWRDRIEELQKHLEAQQTGPNWLTEVARKLLEADNPRVQLDPFGGLVVTGKQVSGEAIVPDLDFGDSDDMLSAMDGEVSLSAHTTHVMTRCLQWAEQCTPPSFWSSFERAAEWHDLGKADPRFQEVLHGDATAAAVSMTNGKLLAKDDGLYRSPAVKRELRRGAGLPQDFRHEMLSLQLVRNTPDLTCPDEYEELVLHLIASHHGYARPFGPVVPDPRKQLPPVDLSPLDIDFVFTQEARRSAVPAYRIDSGVGERFWKLTRKYGWWGLAYLETILRLADWSASADEAEAQVEARRQ